MRRWLVILVAVVAMGCTDEKSTREALEAQGFKSVETLGYDWFACGEDDTFATKFRAVNPAGKSVEGVVCCGWWKNCTVRW